MSRPDQSALRNTGTAPRSSHGAHCAHASAAANETLRRLKHGKVRPLHEPGWIERLLRR